MVEDLAEAVAPLWLQTGVEGKKMGCDLDYRRFFDFVSVSTSFFQQIRCFLPRYVIQ